VKRALSIGFVLGLMLAFAPGVEAAKQKKKKPVKENPACAVVLDLVKAGVPIPDIVVSVVCKKKI
jgi:hypothetical protein